MERLTNAALSSLARHVEYATAVLQFQFPFDLFSRDGYQARSDSIGDFQEFPWPAIYKFLNFRRFYLVSNAVSTVFVQSCEFILEHFDTPLTLRLRDHCHD